MPGTSDADGRGEAPAREYTFRSGPGGIFPVCDVFWNYFCIVFFWLGDRPGVILIAWLE